MNKNMALTLEQRYMIDQVVANQRLEGYEVS